jgi:hypothetical protein
MQPPSETQGREEICVVRAVQHILFADVNARSGIDFGSGLVPLPAATYGEQFGETPRFCGP